MVWAKLITMEFEDQTISETRAGIPVTQMFCYKNEFAFYKGQEFFVGKIIGVSKNSRGPCDAIVQRDLFVFY
jgi:hypothetical protein